MIHHYPCDWYEFLLCFPSILVDISALQPSPDFPSVSELLQNTPSRPRSIAASSYHTTRTVRTPSPPRPAIPPLPILSSASISRATQIDVLLWSAAICQAAPNPSEDQQVYISGCTPESIAKTICDMIAFNSDCPSGSFKAQPGVECEIFPVTAFFFIDRRIAMSVNLLVSISLFTHLYL